MRLLALSLLLAACSGGGGSSSSAPTPTAGNPNPAPGPQPVHETDMRGAWRVVSNQLIQGTPGLTGPLPVDSVAVMDFAAIVSASIPGAPDPVLDRVGLENALGFPVAWHQNHYDGSTAEFGYGWDRLRVPGGGGAAPDYLQYGIRLIALNDNMLAGYEAEHRQDFLGQPRTMWISSILLVRD